ncbi:hypothetical protein QCA50_013065 [Cerrena zonata]|uniref:Uncharacterized protein n=1 Tax=Cerrena zonata TaxID=2478898 RepID=A0AAW0FX62_9APHY
MCVCFQVPRLPPCSNLHRSTQQLQITTDLKEGSSIIHTSDQYTYVQSDQAGSTTNSKNPQRWQDVYSIECTQCWIVDAYRNGGDVDLFQINLGDQDADNTNNAKQESTRMIPRSLTNF